MKHTLFLFLLLSITMWIKGQNVKVEMKTELGSIIAELYPEKAPISCANFIKYIEHHQLEGAHFYRVVRMDNQAHNEVKIEVIQEGLGFDVEESAFPCISHETTNETEILHQDGTLSMARAEPGTASTEFFICIGNQPELDYGGKRNPDGQGFAAFGKIIEGMELVKEIQQMKDEDQMLIEPVRIKSIQIKLD